MEFPLNQPISLFNPRIEVQDKRDRVWFCSNGRCTRRLIDKSELVFMLRSRDFINNIEITTYLHATCFVLSKVAEDTTRLVDILPYVTGLEDLEPHSRNYVINIMKSPFPTAESAIAAVFPTEKPAQGAASAVSAEAGSTFCVPVCSRSPLSRVHAYPIRICGQYFGSIEHAKAYASLLMSGRKDLAVLLLVNPDLATMPGACKNWLLEHGQPDARWVFASSDIYYAIMWHLVHQPWSNPFKDELWSIFEEAVKTRKEPSFMSCSSKHDLVFSCGVRVNSLINEPDREFNVRGFNTYGEVLNMLYNRFAKWEGEPPKWPAECMFHEDEFATGYSIRTFIELTPFRSTVLIVADSFGRDLQSVEQGRVIVVESGSFSALIDAMKKGAGSAVEDYAIVIVHGGTSVAAMAASERSAEVQAVKDYLVDDVAGAGNHLSVIISGAVPVPGSENVSELNSELDEAFRASPVKFVNWSLPENRLATNNTVDEKYLKTNVRSTFWDNNPIGPVGLRALWEGWCKAEPRLRHVGYSLASMRKH